MNLAELRAYHEQYMVGFEDAPNFRRLHEGAIAAIDRTRKGHAHIVSKLLDSLQRKQAALDIANQILHDQAADYFTHLESCSAGWAVTVEELQAEKAITQSLNERLAEFESHGSPETVWVVLKVHNPQSQYSSVEFNGVFKTEQEAIAACYGIWNYMIGPTTLGVAMGDELLPTWPGAYYPNAHLAPEQPAPAGETAEQVPEPENAITAFLSAVRVECDRARGLHPGTEAMCNALAEEVGEVAQALVDEPAANVYTECVQVASTAMRVALEGDRAVDFVRARRGFDALPGSPFEHWNWNEQTLKTPHDLNAVIAHAMLGELTSNNATTSRSETIITLNDPAKFALHLAGIVTGALGVHLGIQSRQDDLPGL